MVIRGTEFMGRRGGGEGCGLFCNKFGGFFQGVFDVLEVHHCSWSVCVCGEER